MNRKIAPNSYRPERGPERAPLGEDDEPDRDPAATADGLVAEPAGRDGERDRRPGQAGQQAADEDVGVARPVDADALGVGGRRALADRAEVEARPRPLDPQPGDRDEQVPDVRQHALVAEEAPARGSGSADRTGIVRRGSSAISPALDRPSPRTRARPVPRNVSASPDTTWSARRWMVMTPWSRLSRPPASIADDDAEPRVAGARPRSRSRRPRR